MKTIRLDTNDGFFRQVYPALKGFGFEIIDENDKFHMQELVSKFPEYKFPGDLNRFYKKFPDRKNSVTIIVEDLKRSLEINNKLENNNTSLKKL